MIFFFLGVVLPNASQLNLLIKMFALFCLVDYIFNPISSERIMEIMTFVQYDLENQYIVLKGAGLNEKEYNLGFVDRTVYGSQI